MEIQQVNGLHPDFVYLSKSLEEFQFNMLPILKDKEYSLTDDLEEIVGFVLYVNNTPVGSIGLKHISEESCEIVRVFVLESHRGNGYAKLLFDKVEDLAKSKGYKKAKMVAWEQATSALTLYKKLNYTISSKQASEWYGGNMYVELYKNL